MAATRKFSLRQSFAQLRIKITLPYVILAILIAFMAAYLVTRLLSNLLEDRFQANLIDAGQKATETLVRIEQEQLAVWRAIAYTDGFSEAVSSGDDDQAASLAMPQLVNAHLDSLVLVNVAGESLTTAYHPPDGGATDYRFMPETAFAQWDIVQNVLNQRVDTIGDKYAAVVDTAEGQIFYTAGPIKQDGEVVGVLLVGTSLERVVQRLDESALARISVYLQPGAPTLTTLAPANPDALAISNADYQHTLADQAQWTHRQDVTVETRDYAEIFGAFEVRHGKDLGVLAVALPLSFVTSAQAPTQRSLLGVFGIATVLVLITGTLVATAVVRRVKKLAAATQNVAAGNLDTHVDMPGHDEVASLAHAFNDMVTQLREGQLYRDLLGLTSSPAIALKLREELAKGQLDLEGQSAVATILFTDIRGFTTLAEGHTPAYIINMLNEYLQGIIKIIQANEGVINKFIGDAALAFFGVLPEAQPPEVSARHALDAALEIIEYLDVINAQREQRGETPIRLGIGINTGPVVAGLVGSQSRFEYTVLGDTVNVTQRLSDLNKPYNEYDLFTSKDTWELIRATLDISTDDGIYINELGDIHVKGRTNPIQVCAIKRGAAGHGT